MCIKIGDNVDMPLFSKNKRKCQVNKKALESMDRNRCLELVNAERQILSYIGSIPQPFCNMLSIADNLCHAIDLVGKNEECAKDSMYGVLQESRSNMRMVLRNFDVVVADQCMESFERERKSLVRRYRNHPHDMIKTYLLSLSYKDNALREWVMDSSERSYLTYVAFREMVKRYGHKYPDLDQTLYYAYCGYVFDRARLLYNTNLI